MLKLLRILDKAIGYAYIPPNSSLNNASSNDDDDDETIDDAALASQLQNLTGLHDIHDVQERWMDNKEAWDEWEGKERDRLEREREAGK